MNRRNFIHITSSTLMLPFIEAPLAIGGAKIVHAQSSFLTVYQHKDFRGISKTINLDEKVINQVYALKSSELSNEISSLKWSLTESKRLILYSDVEGQGKRYSVEGSSEDRDTSRSTFNDVASSYRVIKRNSIPQYFDSIRSTPRILSFYNRDFRKGTDRGWNGHQEHFQGIQIIDDNHIIITTSDFKGAYFFVIKWERGIFSGGIGSVIKEVFIKDDFPDITFDHCSGIQLMSKVVAIGLEYIGGNHDAKRPSSRVVFYDLSNPANPRMLGNPLDRQSKSAGAVGMTFTKENRIVMMVGAKNTLDLDFYLTRRNNQNSITSQTEFERPLNWKWQIVRVLPTRLEKPANGDTRGWLDDRWGHYYEGVNLLRDFDGSLYLVGFNSWDGNWVDLYTLDIGRDNIYLKKISKKKVSCSEGVDFAFGSGVHTDSRKINIIATGNGRSNDNLINLNYFYSE